jgi:hypothetical protein
MSYHLHIPDAVQVYLDNLPMSDEAKRRLERFLDYGIARIDDADRNDPANRPGPPGSPYFVRDLVLLNRWGDGRCHKIDCHVNDANAQHGVLVLTFVDHQVSS